MPPWFEHSRVYQARSRAAFRRLAWMSQSTDLAKEKNFFEIRVTEYQKGSSLDWD